MNKNDLKKILKSHLKWLTDNSGRRADLSGADLREIDLRYANLHFANLNKTDLSGIDLRYANLRYASLSEADLSGAELKEVNLSGANLDRANLRCADLSGVDLRYASLSGADLRGADLRGVNLSRANLDRIQLNKADLSDADLVGAKNIPFIPSIVPEEGSFVGWKKANGYIVKLLIPDSAKRVSGTTRKCRCDKAKVLAIETYEGKPAKIKKIASEYDDRFFYVVGKTVKVDNFENNRFITCAPGIHFFINRQEAVEF